MLGNVAGALEVTIQGAPREAQVVLSQGGRVAYATRTHPETGKATIYAVRPGTYACTVQRRGRKTGRSRSIVVPAGRVQLVVGAADAL
jgi:hypothetical protein